MGSFNKVSIVIEDLSDKPEKEKTTEVTEHKKFDGLIERIFETGQDLDILNDEDVISVEESEKRIQKIFISLYVILTLVAMVEIAILFPRMLNQNKTIVLPFLKSAEKFTRQFPTLHFALIDKNGKVTDKSTKENLSKSKGVLLNLPKTKTYLGYSDSKGVLFFIDGSFKKPVVRYHPEINNRGYDNLWLTQSKMDWAFGKEAHFSSGITVDSRFILMFLKPHNYNSGECIKIQRFTEIWHKRKFRFYTGSKLPRDYYASLKPALVNLNKTHFMIVGFDECPTVPQWRTGLNGKLIEARTAIVNWHDKTWTRLPDLPLQEPVNLLGCQSTLMQDKKLNSKIYAACTEGLNLPNSHVKTLYIYAYELKDEPFGQWSMEYKQEYSQTGMKNDLAVWMHSYQDSLLIIQNDGDILQFSPQTTQMSTFSQVNSSEIHTVIPYYA